MKDVTQDGLGACIVITGAISFIGNNLVRVSLEHGDHASVLTRPGPRHRDALPVHDNLTTVECGLDHMSDYTPAIGWADALLHLAWDGVNREEIDSPRVQVRSVSGSLGYVRTAVRLGCTVFMDAGPRVEYGVVEDVMREDVERHLVDQYGKTKLEFYQKAAPLCGGLNMNYYYLRFLSVYGYGDHPWFIIFTLVRDLKRNKRVSLSVRRHQRNFIYIEDVVQAVYELYRHGVPPVGLRSYIVNIASSDTRPLRSFMEEIHKIAGSWGELGYGTFAQAKEGALSIWPGTGRLLELTGGDWREECTFCRGIEETTEKEEANKRHEGDQRIDSLL